MGSSYTLPSTFLSLYLLLHYSSIIVAPPQVAGKKKKKKKPNNVSMHTKQSISVNFGSCIRIKENFYFLFFISKKKKAENRINLNFPTFNYYYFSRLVLIISVNSDSLVAKCQQVNDHGGNYSPQQTKTTNTL